MRSYGAWFGRLAMAGACLGVAGCGGSDVPNPDSDPSAATEGSRKTVAMAPAAPDTPEAPAAKPEAPAPAAKPDPSGPSAPSAPAPTPAPAPNPGAAPAPGAEAEKPATEAPAPPADGSKPAAPTPGGDASGTDEMLKMAPGGAAAPAPSSPGPSAPAPGGGSPSAPSQPSAPSSPAPNAPGGSTPSTPSVPGAPSADGRPSSDGRPSADGRPGAPGMGTPGGPSGGSMGGSGGGGGANRKTFIYPNTAVAEFLAALKDKNKDRLTEATAKRAATEAVEKHQKIFSEIIDGSISDEELGEMAKAFEGFQVVSILPAKSTGRIGVLVGKQGKSGDYLQRTVTCRKEDGIWKVVDISQMYDFKRTGTTVRRR